jgi:hypothetical protein
MNVKQLVKWELAAEAEVLWRNKPKCHFVHKFNISLRWSISILILEITVFCHVASYGPTGSRPYLEDPTNRGNTVFRSIQELFPAIPLLTQSQP